MVDERKLKLGPAGGRRRVGRGGRQGRLQEGNEEQDLETSRTRS